MGRKTAYVGGWVLVGLVGVLMLVAGFGKVSGTSPESVQEDLRRANLIDWMPILGAGCMTTGVLLLVPQTQSAGVLLASAYWGGAIVTHMMLGDSFAPPAVLLTLTWVGASLRDPRTLASFWPKAGARPAAEANG